MAYIEPLKAAFESSTVVSVVREAWKRSGLDDTTRRTIESARSKLLTARQRIDQFDKTNLRELAQSSEDVYNTAKRSIRITLESSRVVGFFTTTIRWWHGSRFHHWMAKPPDPTIVTIDLKDVMIAGRVIAHIDYVIERIVNDR